MTDYEFDIAVSFAAEDRDYVAAVVEKLKDRDVNVFYDLDHTAEMWGEDLVAFLQEIYGRRARYAIFFVSRHYLERVWTRHERQSAQDRALQQSSPYILPVRLDDTELPGLHSTTGYLDARTVGMEGIVDAVLRKLAGERTETVPRFNGRTPRTSAEIAVLLGERPPGWEYLLYGAAMKLGIEGLEEKYRDHLIEYAPRSERFVDLDDFSPFIQRNMAALSELIDSFNRVLSPDAHVLAFGRPGEAGDPDRILHLASRFVSVYEDFLDWAAVIRGTAVVARSYRKVLDILARWSNEPVAKMREFVNAFVRETDTFVDRLEAGENINLEMRIVLDGDPELIRQLNFAIDAAIDDPDV